uniref:L-gulonolactone oxidase-like n=1 Tax=Dermatophagoides pteronyssinus TaxID=6956 RepID=A0A6P6XJN7_DERPT|nr:L-gulonolactone oxidase-like [Dermatophagoides pteronyssinus]
MDLERIAVAGYQFKNWSNTYQCKPELLFIPETLDEIREILYLAKSEKKHIRIVGCGNSPSDLCCSQDYMISMKNFSNILHIDQQKRIVTVQAGIHLNKLNRILEQNNLALPILGSISESTLAGVISVGTHGTGYHTGIIADYVIAMRLIIPSGDIIYCTKEPGSEYYDIFLSTLCGLGALGIILEVTIECESKFYLHQLTYPSRLDSILERLDENIESCDHFRFLYFPHTDYVSVSITNKVNGEFLNLSQSSQQQNGQMESINQYRLSSERNQFQRICDWLINYGVGYHLLQFVYWLSTFQPSIIPTINRLAFWLLYSSNQVKMDISYKVFNFECLFAQHVNEWSIPRNKTSDALLELKKTIDQNDNGWYAHFPIEVRFVRQSPIYLSPSYGRDSTYINIISYRPYGKHVDHTDYWNCYETIMKRYGGRPHWAKKHRETAVDLIRMYPNFHYWSHIRKRLDPNRLFFNSYLDRIFSTFPTTATTIMAANTMTDITDGDHPHNDDKTEMINNNNNKIEENDHKAMDLSDSVH